METIITLYQKCYINWSIHKLVESLRSLSTVNVFDKKKAVQTPNET